VPRRGALYLGADDLRRRDRLGEVVVEEYNVAGEGWDIPESPELEERGRRLCLT
jgi:hypothetical protein